MVASDGEKAGRTDVARTAGTEDRVGKGDDGAAADPPGLR